MIALLKFAATVLLFAVLGPPIGYIVFHGEGLGHAIDTNEAGLIYAIGGPFAALLGIACGIVGVVWRRLPLWAIAAAGLAAGLTSSWVIASAFDMPMEEYHSALPRYLAAYLVASLACGVAAHFLWRGAPEPAS